MVSLAGVVPVVHMDVMKSTRVIRGSVGLMDPRGSPLPSRRLLVNANRELREKAHRQLKVILQLRVCVYSMVPCDLDVSVYQQRAACHTHTYISCGQSLYRDSAALLSYRRDLCV